MKKAVVIGSGIAGIAASIRLAAKGYRVEVFEANSYPGGKLSEIRLGAYRFDAGPSLFTLPSLVDELFELCGENPRQYFSYVRLYEITRYFYDDGTQITAYGNPARFAEEIEQKTGEPATQVERFLSRSREMYELTAPVFLHHSLHRLKTYFSRHTIRALLHIHKIDLWHTMDQFNQSYFKDARIITLFNRFATYNGSDPFQAPAILSLIPHLEHHIGAFFPTAGMYAITQSLYELARSLGVVFYFNTRVDKIIHAVNKANGIMAAGEKHEADLVVCNMDITNAYRKLLPDIKEPIAITNQSKSSSGIVFYWGIRKEFPALHLHNIFFSSNYKKEFDYIFNKGTVYSDPTVYINITSKLKKDDAPQGCENWFVMINVPHDCGQNWSELIASSKANVLRKLSVRLQTDIEPLIETEDVLHPTLIEERTSSHLGAIYGSNSNSRYAAFLRHANFSSRLNNLYFCGGSVHPGGGIPLSLLSAKIVASLIDEIEK